MGEINKFWLLGGSLPQSTGFPTNVWEKGGSPYLVGATKQHQKREHFCLKGRYRGYNSDDNHARHYFILRDLVPRTSSSNL